jgi:hypothetical protein
MKLGEWSEAKFTKGGRTVSCGWLLALSIVANVANSTIRAVETSRNKDQSHFRESVSPTVNDVVLN